MLAGLSLVTALAGLPPLYADDGRLDYAIGEALFGRAWVSAPSSTQAADGLGPLYSARSCNQCHVQARPRQRQGGNSVQTPRLLVQLGIPAVSPSHGQGVVPDPVYGAQLQEFAIPGHAAEGQLQVDYQPRELRLSDDSVVVLHKPVYALRQLAYGPAHPQLILSPRRAPMLNGLGLLEAIAESDILALADPEDHNGDGISGRPNRVWSDSEQKMLLGRYGWKAGSPGIPDQIQRAFVQDLGLSTPLHPQTWGDCSVAQNHCRAAPHGASAQYDDLEIPQTMIDLVTHYVRYQRLSPPTPSTVAALQSGRELFRQSGCAACHVERQVTARDYAIDDLAGRTFFPYSDLLLHDMGESLADDRPEYAASGREWRTAPLWGLRFNPGHYLHDGRARSVLEAILWHDGEARAARLAVTGLSTVQRRQLVRFIESL